MTLAYLQLLRVLRQRIPSPRPSGTIGGHNDFEAVHRARRPFGAAALCAPYSWFTAAGSQSHK